MAEPSVTCKRVYWKHKSQNQKGFWEIQGRKTLAEVRIKGEA
jgi:hypothetical protein